MANYSCRKRSPKTYPLARVHPLQMTTDRQTDWWMTIITKAWLLF